MPISGASSYIPTLNDFLPHWDLVNTTLGVAGPLVLRNPNGPTPPTINRAALVTMRNDLQAKHTDITDQMNNVQIAAAALRIMKAGLHLRGSGSDSAVAAQQSSPQSDLRPESGSTAPVAEDDKELDVTFGTLVASGTSFVLSVLTAFYILVCLLPPARPRPPARGPLRHSRWAPVKILRKPKE